MTKGMDERIDESVHRWFVRVERRGNDKGVHALECVGSHSIGRSRKRWIDIIKEWLLKEVWMSGKQGERCMIGVNGRVL